MLQNNTKEQEDSYHVKKLNTSLDEHKGSLLEVSQAETGQSHSPQSLKSTCRCWLDNSSSNWWVSQSCMEIPFCHIERKDRRWTLQIEGCSGRRLAQAGTCLRRAGPTCGTWDQALPTENCHLSLTDLQLTCLLNFVAVCLSQAIGPENSAVQEWI